MGRQHIPAETKNRIKELIRRGESVANVHNRFSGISLSTIKRYRGEVKAELAQRDHESRDR